MCTCAWSGGLEERQLQPMKTQARIGDCLMEGHGLPCPWCGFREEWDQGTPRALPLGHTALASPGLCTDSLATPAPLPMNRGSRHCILSPVPSKRYLVALSLFVGAFKYRRRERK